VPWSRGPSATAATNIGGRQLRSLSALQGGHKSTPAVRWRRYGKASRTVLGLVI
jgi:hypothetical protein